MKFDNGIYFNIIFTKNVKVLLTCGGTGDNVKNAFRLFTLSPVPPYVHTDMTFFIEFYSRILQVIK